MTSRLPCLSFSSESFLRVVLDWWHPFRGKESVLCLVMLMVVFTSGT